MSSDTENPPIDDWFRIEPDFGLPIFDFGDFCNLCDARSSSHVVQCIQIYATQLFEYFVLHGMMIRMKCTMDESRDPEKPRTHVVSDTERMNRENKVVSALGTKMVKEFPLPAIGEGERRWYEGLVQRKGSLHQVCIIFNDFGLLRNVQQIVKHHKFLIRLVYFEAMGLLDQFFDASIDTRHRARNAICLTSELHIPHFDWCQAFRLCQFRQRGTTVPLPKIEQREEVERGVRRRTLCCRYALRWYESVKEEPGRLTSYAWHEWVMHKTAWKLKESISETQLARYCQMVTSSTNTLLADNDSSSNKQTPYFTHLPTLKEWVEKRDKEDPDPVVYSFSLKPDESSMQLLYFALQGYFSLRRLELVTEQLGDRNLALIVSEYGKL
jgi:hypothetical protein